MLLQKCHVLLVRREGTVGSFTMSQEHITKITNEYEIPLDQLYRSVVSYNNQPQPATFDYADDGSFPPCFFGLPYLEGRFNGDFPSNQPACDPANEELLPGYLKGSQHTLETGCVDAWNVPF